MNSHRKQLISLAHPVYLSLLASVAAGIINTVWVARLGGPAVAAVAVATSTENVLLGIALVFASGTTVLVAHARGARDPAALRSAVRGGWALCALVTPVVVTAGFLLRAPCPACFSAAQGPNSRSRSPTSRSPCRASPSSTPSNSSTASSRAPATRGPRCAWPSWPTA